MDYLNLNYTPRFSQHEQPTEKIPITVDPDQKWDDIFDHVKNTPREEVTDLIVNPLNRYEFDQGYATALISMVYNKIIEPHPELLGQLWISNTRLLSRMTVWVVHFLLRRYHNGNVRRFTEGLGVDVHVSSRKEAGIMRASLIKLFCLFLDTVMCPVDAEIDYTGKVKESFLRSELYDWSPTIFAIDLTTITTPEQMQSVVSVLENRSDTKHENRQVIVWTKYGKNLDLPNLERFVV